MKRSVVRIRDQAFYCLKQQACLVVAFNLVRRHFVANDNIPLFDEAAVVFVKVIHSLFHIMSVLVRIIFLIRVREN